MEDIRDGKRAEDEQRRATRLWRISSGGLHTAISRAGGELLGMSVRYGKQDCLVTLRLRFPAGRFVCFVGGYSLAECLLKAYRDANNDRLKLKVDEYVPR